MIRHVDISECRYGDILGREVINKSGVMVVAANTMMNNYIKKKLIHLGIQDIWVYEPEDNELITFDCIEYSNFKLKYENNIFTMKEVINDLVTGKGLNVNRVQDIANSIFGELKQVKYLIKYLRNLRKTDDYTCMHSINVAFYGMLIGKWLKLPEKEIKEIIKAGLLHDIGKTKISMEILNKKERLSPLEYEEMKNHTIYGYEIIKGNNEISEEVKRAVLMHHERENNSGYPIGVKGESIDTYSKIIAVADVYDAMTSDRVYKKRSTPFDAFRMFEIEGKSLFDVKVVRTFITNIAPYYTGLCVQLNTGEYGEIAYIPPHNITKPVICMRADFIDISERNDLRIVSLL
ncbi:MAG: HD-GYP domain-containing protein [Bacillota bacterium]